VNHGHPIDDDEIIDIVDYGVRGSRRRAQEDAGRGYEARRHGLMDENERLAREASRLAREVYDEPRRYDGRRYSGSGGGAFN
jgi:hypothetical protein